MGYKAPVVYFTYRHYLYAKSGGIKILQIGMGIKLGAQAFSERLRFEQCWFFREAEEEGVVSIVCSLSGIRSLYYLEFL